MPKPDGSTKKSPGLNKQSWQFKDLLLCAPPWLNYPQKDIYYNAATPNHGTWLDKANVLWELDPVMGPVLYFPGGTGDEITFVNQDWMVNLGAISVCAWAKRDDAWSQDMLVSKHLGTTTGSFYLAAVNASSVRMSVVTAGGKVDHDANYGIPQNAWQHFVGTYDGSAIKLYINGFQSGGTSAQSGVVKTSVQEVMIGDFAGVNWQMKGWIADPRIYARALTAPEVHKLYDPRTRWELYKSPLMQFSYPSNPIVTSTYEEALTLSRTHALTLSAAQVFEVAIEYGKSNGMDLSVAGEWEAAVTFAYSYLYPDPDLDKSFETITRIQTTSNLRNSIRRQYVPDYHRQKIDGFEKKKKEEEDE